MGFFLLLMVITKKGHFGKVVQVLPLWKLRSEPWSGGTIVQPAAYGHSRKSRVPFDFPSTSAQACDNIGSITRERQVLAMDAMELLKEPGRLQEIVKRYQQQLEELRQSPISGYGHRERVQQSRNIHKMDDLMVKIERLEADCAEYGNQYLDAVDRFNKYVFQLNNALMIGILFERYMFGNSYKQAARKLGYSEQYLKSIHQKTIKALQEILDKENAA